MSQAATTHSRAVAGDPETHDPPFETDAETHAVEIRDGDETHWVTAEDGANLRDILIESEHSPHGAVTDWINCQGSGMCALCHVEVEAAASEPPLPTADAPVDAVAQTLAGRRLACQIEVDRDLIVDVD